MSGCIAVGNGCSSLQDPETLGLADCSHRMFNNFGGWWQHSKYSWTDFLEYLFKFTVEENDTVSNEGQNKDHDEAQHMTVYVKTISGYLFKFTNEVNSTVSNEGCSKDRGGVPYMTVS